MPRRARLVLPNVPLHIIQRGNNRQACYYADEDYRFYLDWLRGSSKQFYCPLKLLPTRSLTLACGTWHRVQT